MPNILITGTPGTGKTSLARRLAQESGLQHLDISELVQLNKFHDGWDEQFQSWFLNEDQLLDYMEDELQIHTQRKYIVDYHGCDFFPERWFDLVVVLRCDNTILYNRLEKRNYPAHKIQENVTAEIMQVLLDEAQENYKPEIVIELQSNTPEDAEANIQRLLQWIRSQPN